MYLGYLFPIFPWLLLNAQPPRFAGNNSPLGWFNRLAGLLLRKTRQVLRYPSVPAIDSFFFRVFSIRVARVMGK